MIYYKQEKFNLAEIHFRKALSINPSSSVLYCHVGVVSQLNLKTSFEGRSVMEVYKLARFAGFPLVNPLPSPLHQNIKVHRQSSPVKTVLVYYCLKFFYLYNYFFQFYTYSFVCLLVKVFCICFGFAFLRYAIGLKISRHLPKVNNDTLTDLHTFSRALRRQHIVLIGSLDYLCPL